MSWFIILLALNSNGEVLWNLSEQYHEPYSSAVYVNPESICKQRAAIMAGAKTMAIDETPPEKRVVQMYYPHCIMLRGGMARNQ